MTAENNQVTATYKIPITILRKRLWCPRCDASLARTCWSRKNGKFFCLSCAEAITREFWDDRQGIVRGGGASEWSCWKCGARTTNGCYKMIAGEKLLCTRCR